MSSPNDFVIENGVLKDYTSSDKNIVIPDGVISIEADAFGRIEAFGQADRTPNACITIPESVTTTNGAFSFVLAKEVTLPIHLADEVLFEPSFIPEVIMNVLRPGKEPKRVIAALRSTGVSLKKAEYKHHVLAPLSENAALFYDRLVASGSYDKFKLSKDNQIRAALWRLADEEYPVEQGMKQLFEVLLVSKISKVIALAEEDHAPSYITTLFSSCTMDEKTIKKAKKALSASGAAEIRTLADTFENTAEPADTEKKEEIQIDVPQKIILRLKEINSQKLISKTGATIPNSVMMADGSTVAPNQYMQLILAEYIRQADSLELSFAPLADEAAALLEHGSLINALKNAAFSADGETNQARMLLPLFRYCDGSVIRELFPGSYKVKRKADIAKRALVLSDTKEAVFFADELNMLDWYAKIRNTDADDIRDGFLSDIGLDEQGSKIYDLGNQTVTARLQKDLSFLVELPTGKTSKSLPKKDSDAEKFEAANKDFSETKKAAKKILNSRGKALFRDFLSGRERSSNDWQNVYLKNPLLREAASLIVWAQGKQTFTLASGWPIDSMEQPYQITDEPIRVAHPMEMTAEDTTAWQKYFTSHGLKQPFQQVWEPVRRAEQIAEDRYNGCVLEIYQLNGKDKHGIHSFGLHAYSEEFGFNLDDCELEYEPSTWRLSWDGAAGETYTLGKFTFPKFNRQVNHIVTVLDSLTVADRLKKDDVTVMDLMPGFTLAQITEFISAAQEANAVNVLAALLEYKNANFADFDPMDEFTLEW